MAPAFPASVIDNGERQPRALALDGGPLAGESWWPAEWPWDEPPTVVWLSRDAAGRLVPLGPDKELLNLVGRRARTGELGWVPYRRARVDGEPGRPVLLGGVQTWRFEHDAAQDPAQRLRAVG